MGENIASAIEFGPIAAAKSAPVEPAGSSRVLPSGSVTDIWLGPAVGSAVGIPPMIGTA